MAMCQYKETFESEFDMSCRDIYHGKKDCYLNPILCIEFLILELY